MKKLSTFKLLTMLAAVGVSGTALADTAPSELQIDSKTEVAYTCQITEGKTTRSQKLTAMYGIKNGEPIVAQVKVNNDISIGLFRVADPLLNRFVGENEMGMTIWTTLPANGAQIRHVDGGKLSFQRNNNHSIIAENCKLDKAATAKLK